MNKLEAFITKNGLKKKWLAKALGIEPEHLRYYFRKNQPIPEPLNTLALSRLRKLHADIDLFLVGAEKKNN